MKIHDKEVGFIYTVGAHADYFDYVVANPDVSTVTADLHQTEIMSREYAKLHPEASPITVDELRSLMVYELSEIQKAVKEAIATGMKRTVETADTKKKVKGNALS